MVKKNTYADHRQNKDTLKFKVLMVHYTLGMVFVLAFWQVNFAQNAEIEKTTSKPVKSSSRNFTNKSSTKKPVEPRKSTPAKSTPSRSSKRSTVNRKSKAKTKDIAVTFNTIEPNLEIWRGEKMLGVSDENAVLETSLIEGSYLITLKNPAGEISHTTLINVNASNNEFTLTKKEEEENEVPETTAEELLQEQLKESIDAADKINDILARYGDPLKTSTVTVEDWEFVYQMAQANKLQNFTAIQIEAQRWFSSGQIELAKGNYANAYAAFTKAVEFMPDSAYPYFALGEAYTANKQFNDAYTAYQKAVQINPKFALAHRKIGDIHTKSNRNKEATISYQTAITNGFDTPSLHYELAKSHLKNKRWDDASKELELVVKEAPTGDVFITLGDLYIELKRNISAYEAYRKATELSPNSGLAFYKLGESLFNEREFEKAKVALEKALELDEKGKEINVSQTTRLVREAAQKMR